MENLDFKIRNYLLCNNLYKKLNLQENFNISFLAQGEYNINYKIEDSKNKYVFRINTASQLNLDNQIEYEFNALKILKESTVTPKPLYVDGTKEFFNFGILIMEFLNGVPLNYSTDLHKATDIFSKIHTLDIPKNSGLIVETNIMSDRISESSWLLKDFFNSSISNLDLKRFFHNYLNWCEKNKFLEKYFINNDLLVINNTEVNSHNFIIGENSYLIDWEKPVISHPCQDLTQFLADTTTLWRSNYLINSKDKDDFLKLYCSKTNFNFEDIKESINLYNPYLYLRALSWCAMALVKYQTEEKLIRNDEIFNKIQQYLNKDFINNLLKEYIDFKI